MATVIDKSLLRSLRSEIDAALAPLAGRHGLASLRAGNASFDPVAGTFTFKLEGAAEGAIGKEAALYQSPDARFLNLPPLGTTFTSGGKTYRTAGLKANGRRVVCQHTADGKPFLFWVEDVVRLCKVSDGPRPPSPAIRARLADLVEAHGK